MAQALLFTLPKRNQISPFSFRLANVPFGGMSGRVRWLLLIALFTSAQARQARKPPRNSPTYMERLWGGEDVDATDRHMRTLKVAHDFYPGVQMLGPPDSGTNLWDKMVHLNWPGLKKECAEQRGGPLDNIVWKHALNDAQEITQLYKRELPDLTNTTLTVMIRSPIAQLASWKKKPYSLGPCFTHRDVNDWNAPCYSNTKADHHDSTPGVSIFQEDDVSNHFESSMDVYNQYMRQYLDLVANTGGFKQVLLIPYEDLVLSPEAVLEEFAEASGFPRPSKGSDWLIPGESETPWAKDSHGRDAAIQKVGERAFLHEFSHYLPLICNGLDTKAIQQFSEGTYTSDPRPYAQDCESRDASRRRRGGDDTEEETEHEMSSRRSRRHSTSEHRLHKTPVGHHKKSEYRLHKTPVGHHKKKREKV